MTSQQPPDAFDGIAVIGMAGRFPGALDIEAFWQNLCDGVESIAHFSDEELLASGISSAIINNPRYVKAKGIVAGIDLFDAAFFGYSPRDAKTMDPQHRFFLECAYEALEHAGYVPKSYPDRIAVYAGASLNTYLLATNLFTQLSMSGDPVPTIINNDKDFLATRVSYKLNLRGPSVTVQTACSTSLVAVHMACQSLLSGECTMALAGGVSLRVPQKEGYLYQGEGIVSPDGHCRAFDAQGSGTVVGEGVGVVVLKRLEDALAEKDHILAVIKGSAMNNDGSNKIGYTAPGMSGQVEVIEEALAMANVDPETISYVEAHGTGTALGDPLEIAALTQAFHISTSSQKYSCAIGSVKTNIGHLDAAAGVAGLIKTVLALYHKNLPPSLHFEKPNPQIDFANSPFYVNTRLTAWQTHGPRRAGVSSFGIGGTNVHIVLEEAPVVVQREQRQEPDLNRFAYMLPLSARSAHALQELIQAYHSWLFQHKDIPLRNICAGASLRRSHYEHRLALVGDSPSVLAEQAQAFLQGELSAQEIRTGLHKVVFVCPGQGSQWKGMARLLLEREPIFREQMQRCEEAMRPYVSWSLVQLIQTEAEWQDIAIIQPALFAIQVSLAALWQSWGIKPDAVIGHSMGEVAAACIAGILPLTEAARLICLRSQLLSRIRGKGAMLLVELTRAQAEQVIIDDKEHVSIAVSNSPLSTVLAGDAQTLATIGKRLETEGVFWRWIKVDVASHSPQVDVLREDLLQTLRSIQPAKAQIPFYSTVMGQQLTGMELDAHYWVNNLREPVQFARTIQLMLGAEHDTFIELSSHPLLLTAIQENLEALGKEGVVLPSMRREKNERSIMLQTLGTLYTHGIPVDWAALYPEGSLWVPLPTYPFQRQRYWIEPHEFATAVKGSLTHHMEPRWLGPRLRSPLRQTVFESHFSRALQPLFDDHCIQNITTVPVTVYVEMAFAAAREVYGVDTYILEEFIIHEHLFLLEDADQTIQVVVTSGEKATEETHIQIFSLSSETHIDDKETWTLHTSARIRPCSTEAYTSPLNLLEAQSICQIELSVDAVYHQLRAEGLKYGRNLRVIQQLRRGANAALALIQWPEAKGLASETEHAEPPLFLEIGSLVLYAAMSSANGYQIQSYPYMPVRLQCIQRSTSSTPVWCYASVQQHDQLLVGNLYFFDERGQITSEIVALQMARLTREDMNRPIQACFQNWLYEMRWEPKPRGKIVTRDVRESGVWVILADQGGIGVALAQRLVARGEQACMVFFGEAFTVDGNEQYHVNPTQQEDMQLLLEEIAHLGGKSCRGIVHLWNLDAPSTEVLTADTLETAQVVGCGSVLHLVQALAGYNQKPEPRLWLVTRGAQLVGDSEHPVAIAQASVWGLGLVIAIEHPAIWGGQIDLEPGTTVDAVAPLLEELLAPDGEDQIVFRQHMRYTARLMHSQSCEQRVIQWRTDGIYLITGGLGYLGLAIARWLVEQGVRHVWLLGRTGLAESAPDSDKKRLALQSLENMGAIVRVIQADVSVPADMVQIAEQLKSTQMPLSGIIHAAGVAVPESMIKMSWQTLLATLRPKVLGTWLLHQLVQEEPLDFFIFFSSIVALWGSRELAHHAAANCFLDAFAHYRHTQGHTALSINWGPWAGGSHSSLEAQSQLDRMGINAFLLEQGMGVLDTVIGMNTAQVAAAQIDWNTLKPGYEARTGRRLLEHISVQEKQVFQLISTYTSVLLRRLNEVQSGERRDVVQVFVRGEVAAVLGLERPQSLDTRQPLRTLGLESLMAIELRNRLQSGIGSTATLPSTIVFEYPTIEALVDFLLQDVFGWSTSSETDTKAQLEKEQQNQMLVDLEQLPAEDVEASLLEELERAGY